MRPAFDAVVEAVASAFDETRASLRQRSHRPARKARAQLAWEEAGLTLAAIGEWLGLTDRAVDYYRQTRPLPRALRLR